MKIKRFQAADVRQAIREVREVLGPDAVILSNTRVDGGVEIVAATDYDETQFRRQNNVPVPQLSQKNPKLKSILLNRKHLLMLLRNRISGRRNPLWFRCARKLPVCGICCKTSYLI